MTRRERNQSRKGTKRALTGSILAIVLCVVLLAGATFAWFTDTASTKVSNIQAGTLKVDIVDTNGDSVQGEPLNFKTADNRTTEILWEPGATYELPAVQVVNKGNLALKYKVVFTAVEGDQSLAEALEIGKIVNGAFVSTSNTLADALNPTNRDGSEDTDGFAHGKLAAQGATEPMTFALRMKTTAGNEYQNKSITSLTVSVLATQDTVEVDSKDNTYDENAKYPEVKTAEELKSALTPVDGSSSTAVALASDIVITEEWDPLEVGTYSTGGYPNTEELVIDGQGHTIYGLTAALVTGDVAKKVTIKNLTIADSNITSDNPVGSGAFIEGQYDGGTSLTLENCHAVNVTVNGEKTGTAALVGYLSCDSASIKNCSVKNCTVNGSSNAAGIVGFTSARSTIIENCSVTDSTFTSTDDGAWRVGAIFGTMTTDTTVSGCTESGNIYTQASASTSATSNLYGRVVSGTLTND